MSEPLSLSFPRKISVARSTDCIDMTIAVEWDVKPQTRPNKQDEHIDILFHHYEGQLFCRDNKKKHSLIIIRYSWIGVVK